MPSSELFSVPSGASSSTGPLSQLCRVVLELHSTEESYSTCLSTLLSHFISPLRSDSTLAASLSLRDEERESWGRAWGALDPIVQLAQEVCVDLHALVDPDRLYSSASELVAQVANVFLKHAPYLRLYCAYVDVYASCLALLSPSSVTGADRDRKKLRRWIDEVERAHGAGHNAASMLIMPIQRLPRYELLLNKVDELFGKHLQTLQSEQRQQSASEGGDAASEDESVESARSLLSQAIEKVHSLNLRLNEWKRSSESKARLCALNQSIRGLPSGYTILESHRRYVLDTPALLAFPNPSARRPLHLWLTTDALLMVSRDKCKVKGWIELTDVSAVCAREQVQATFDHPHAKVWAQLPAPERCVSVESMHSTSASAVTATASAAAPASSPTAALSGPARRRTFTPQTTPSLSKRLSSSFFSSASSAAPTPVLLSPPILPLPSPREAGRVSLTPVIPQSSPRPSLVGSASASVSSGSGNGTSLLIFEFADESTARHWAQLLQSTADAWLASKEARALCSPRPSISVAPDFGARAMEIPALSPLASPVAEREEEQENREQSPAKRQRLSDQHDYAVPQHISDEQPLLDPAIDSSSAPASPSLLRTQSRARTPTPSRQDSPAQMRSPASTATVHSVLMLDEDEEEEAAMEQEQEKEEQEEDVAIEMAAQPEPQTEQQRQPEPAEPCKEQSEMEGEEQIAETVSPATLLQQLDSELPPLSNLPSLIAVSSNTHSPDSFLCTPIESSPSTAEADLSLVAEEEESTLLSESVVCSGSKRKRPSGGSLDRSARSYASEELSLSAIVLPYTPCVSTQPAAVESASQSCTPSSGIPSPVLVTADFDAAPAPPSPTRVLFEPIPIEEDEEEQQGQQAELMAMQVEEEQVVLLESIAVPSPPRVGVPSLPSLSSLAGPEPLAPTASPACKLVALKAGPRSSPKASPRATLLSRSKQSASASRLPQAGPALSARPGTARAPRPTSAAAPSTVASDVPSSRKRVRAPSASPTRVASESSLPTPRVPATQHPTTLAVSSPFRPVSASAASTAGVGSKHYLSSTACHEARKQAVRAAKQARSSAPAPAACLQTPRSARKLHGSSSARTPKRVAKAAVPSAITVAAPAATAAGAAASMQIDSCPTDSLPLDQPLEQSESMELPLHFPLPTLQSPARGSTPSRVLQSLPPSTLRSPSTNARAVLSPGKLASTSVANGTSAVAAALSPSKLANPTALTSPVASVTRITRKQAESARKVRALLVARAPNGDGELENMQPM